jgi:GTP1/Obg family GTP-binding protein
MNLQQRIKKIAQQTAPIKAEQERKRAAQEIRESLLSHLKDRIADSLSLSRYVHGDLPDEQELIKDLVERNILFQSEARNRYGVEDGKIKATDEQLKDINREVIRRFELRFHNHRQTPEQYDEVDEQWEKARADMEAGVASADSEAAEYLRRLLKRYPRVSGAKRFYRIWD